MIEAAGGADKVGMKISPPMPFNDIHADPVETYTTLVRAVAPLGLGYLHVLRTELPNTFDLLRPLYRGTFMAGGGFTRQSGDEAIRSGLADFVVYGKLFTSNPDVPRRFANDAELVAPNQATFYTPGPEGYTSYASL